MIGVLAYACETQIKASEVIESLDRNAPAWRGFLAQLLAVQTPDSIINVLGAQVPQFRDHKAYLVALLPLLLE